MRAKPIERIYGRAAVSDFKVKMGGKGRICCTY
jgi:hypothetical protein